MQQFSSNEEGFEQVMKLAMNDMIEMAGNHCDMNNHEEKFGAGAVQSSHDIAPAANAIKTKIIDMHCFFS